MDSKLSLKVHPYPVPVCLLLSDLQLAAVGGGAVIRIVKVAVLVEDESCAARGDVDPQKCFGSR
jgi:hypothetical protein